MNLSNDSFTSISNPAVHFHLQYHFIILHQHEGTPFKDGNMNIAASELVDIFFKEQFRGIEENPHGVIQNGAHRELSIHSILLSSSSKG
jgi:hypothetical protein